MAKDVKKRKPVNSILVTRGKGDEGDGRLYEAADHIIEEHFPDLRELDYVIVLKKNWRADADDNRKWAEASLQNEEARLILKKGQGRDCVLKLNADVFDISRPEVQLTDGVLQFWLYQAFASIDVDHDKDGGTKRDERNLVVYRKRRPNLAIFQEAFQHFGLGGLKPLAELAVNVKAVSAAFIENQQRLFWPEDDVDAVHDPDEAVAAA